MLKDVKPEVILMKPDCPNVAIFLRPRTGRKLAFLLLLLIGLPITGFAQKKERLAKSYRDWLTQDVVYIITKDERDEFVKLTTDEARDKFIKDFWDIRNPTPGAEINAYKEEFYQRIAFANSRFGPSSGTDGWRTDRGHTYITLGAPQQKQLYRNAANLRPIEVWFYANVSPALPTAFYVMFFDRDNTGDYRFYSPYFDGPDKLTTGVEATNSPQAGLHMIINSVGGELARQSLSLIVGEPVDLRNPRPSLQSDTMLDILRSLADQPSSRDDIRRRRMNREQVRSSLILEGRNLDIILLPVRDPHGITRLDYSVRLKNPNEFSVTVEKDERLSYSVQIKVLVFDLASNVLVLTSQKDLHDTFDKNHYRDIKNKAFSYESMLPLPPGKYRLSIQFTDWGKNTSYRTEREVTIPKTEAGRLELPGVLPFSAAEQIDPFAAEVTPFTLAGVKFTPLSTSNLFLASDQSLEVAYQIWTAPGDPRANLGKKLVVDYGLGQPALPGSAKSFKDEVDLAQFDAGGSLLTGKKLALQPEIGSYILTLSATGSLPDNHLFSKLNVKVTDPSALPPEPWIVEDSTIREDMEKGVFDRQRGLVFIAQGLEVEGRRWLRRALAADHGDEFARSRLVEAYFSREDYAAVSALYKDAGVTDNADATTLLRIATSLRRVGKEDEGLRLLEKGVATHSESASMYMALGDFYNQMGKPELASSAIQKGKSLSVPN
jgi:GWxTD domain-containing protein